jgi:hypothetical protein
VPKQPRSGTGQLRSGQRDLGVSQYEIHVGLLNKRETVVELESPPAAQNGEILDLILENGQVLRIQVSSASPYCRVISGRLSEEQRGDDTGSVSWDIGYGRRRSDTTNAMVIQHPCPRCMAGEVLVTHRGVTMTTLLCAACRHVWGAPPAAVAAATRMDRRATARAASAERRGADRLQAPTCSYCATDAYVRSVRRTSHEVYFACDGCEAMWALSRPRSTSPHQSFESR